MKLTEESQVVSAPGQQKEMVKDLLSLQQRQNASLALLTAEDGQHTKVSSSCSTNHMRMQHKSCPNRVLQ